MLVDSRISDLSGCAFLILHLSVLRWPNYSVQVLAQSLEARWGETNSNLVLSRLHHWNQEAPRFRDIFLSLILDGMALPHSKLVHSLGVILYSQLPLGEQMQLWPRRRFYSFILCAIYAFSWIRRLFRQSLIPAYCHLSIAMYST